jgi:hypothetical protein
MKTHHRLSTIYLLLLIALYMSATSFTKIQREPFDCIKIFIQGLQGKNLCGATPTIPFNQFAFSCNSCGYTDVKTIMIPNTPVGDWGVQIIPSFPIFSIQNNSIDPITTKLKWESIPQVGGKPCPTVTPIEISYAPGQTRYFSVYSSLDRCCFVKEVPCQ